MFGKLHGQPGLARGGGAEDNEHVVIRFHGGIVASIRLGDTMGP